MTSLQEVNENLRQQIIELTFKLELKDKEIEQMKSPPKSSNQFETQTLELQLIQYKHLQTKLENENEQLRSKLNQMVNSQVEAQKALLKQKQQMQNVNKNLFSLSSQIQEEDSPIKLIIDKLIDKEKDQLITQSLDVESQLKMNEIKRINNQLSSRIQQLEEKSQNMIARQFQDAATILKLKKEKQGLIDQLQRQGQELEQELQKSRVQTIPDIAISFSDLYFEIPYIEQIKEKFELLIQQILQQLLSQNSNCELGESLVKTHRSSSSRRLDQVQNQFSDILKYINRGSQKNREFTLENQIFESFIYEKPTTNDKSSQTSNIENDVNAENLLNIESKLQDNVVQSPRFQGECKGIDAEQQTEDIDLNQFLLNSMTPLMFSAIPQLHTESDLIDEQQQGQDKSAVCLRNGIKNDSGFDEGQLIGIVEQLTLQLKYTKKQWYNSVDKCLRAQEELERLSEIEAQYNHLSQQYLNSKNELAKQKNKYKLLLDKYFDLELKYMQQ
ncbi:unnamed protein product [Paramecium pentaurelia]|uniref:Uncharacterized protein n=1 Tax=Paramecium pentaurelia TaxID=43138 RepID=A0A8S1UUJ9_9CILI|nr:unnamed protein product [Paramecium pentaurelia]